MTIENVATEVTTDKPHINKDAVKKNLNKIVRNINLHAFILIVTTDFPHSTLRKQNSIMEREKIIQWNHIIFIVKIFKMIVHSMFQKKK